MKFSIVKDQFLEGLQRAQHIVSSRATLPILSNVRLEAREGQLELTTTDLDVGIVCAVPAEITTPGVSTLPARKLFSIIKELPTSEFTITIDETNSATIESGTAFFRILGLDAEEFPELPKLEDAYQFVLPQPVLRDAIRKTSYAISSDETRYVLNGVLLAFKDQKMTMVATDGRRLSLQEVEVEFDSNQDCGVIIPTKAVNEIERMLEEEGEIEILISSNYASFRASNRLLLTKLIDGNFPNFRQVIPSQPSYKVSIDREILFSTVNRVSLLLTDRSQKIKLHFENNALVISSEVQEIGEAREQIPIHYEGEPLQIGFNADFLMAPLRKISSDEIIIELIDEITPGVIKVPGENFLYVIMPLRT